jgi:catechol 2,3-dioxygenase
MPETARPVAYELRVRDLETCMDFYTRVLGLEVADTEGPRVVLAPAGRRYAVALVHDPDAPLRPQPTIGLFHTAMLVPDRPALGAVLRRVLESGWPLEGAADHAVSEAVYLRDPENNGIELYRDRPKEQWPHRWGEVVMVSEPFDDRGVLGEAPGPSALHADTVLGHVHLHVPSLEEAEEFYSRGLGLGVTQRSFPGALFMAAGDYHHHLGTNTWAQGRTAPPSSTGLLSYEWRIPGDALGALDVHLAAAGVPHARSARGLEAVDPSGVTVVVDAA